jgi:hypothetical protein
MTNTDSQLIRLHALGDNTGAMVYTAYTCCTLLCTIIQVLTGGGEHVFTQAKFIAGQWNHLCFIHTRARLALGAGSGTAVACINGHEAGQARLAYPEQRSVHAVKTRTYVACHR